MGIRGRLAGGSLGFGAAPLGNMFRELTDEDAAATVDAAWRAGTRFFDTAPQYGAGLSEIRLGRQLAEHDRDEYELSTKVGRLVLDELDTGPRQFGEKGGSVQRRPRQPHGVRLFRERDSEIDRR